MKKIISPLGSVLSLVWLSAACLLAQDVSPRQSFGVAATFAPNSSHILIGSAEDRQTWTAGLEYCRTLWGNRSVRLVYEGSISPFFVERDPTLIGFEYVPGGPITPTTPDRIITKYSPTAQPQPGVTVTTVTNVYGKESTYAFTASPLGVRVNGLNSHRLQPTFSLDLGFVASSRDLPIDYAASFNYLFSFGPGFEFFYSSKKSVRLEYLYRHMSNAGSGHFNPGVDQGVFRVTLSRGSH